MLATRATIQEAHATVLRRVECNSGPPLVPALADEPSVKSHAARYGCIDSAEATGYCRSLVLSRLGQFRKVREAMLPQNKLLHFA